DSPSDDFDRQRDAVDTATYFGNERCVFVSELEAGITCQSAIDEELDRRKGQSLAGFQADMWRGKLQRVQPVRMLTFHAHRLATGCEDVRLGCSAEHRLCRRRGGIDHMLAVVEDDQCTPCLQITHQGG